MKKSILNFAMAAIILGCSLTATVAGISTVNVTTTETSVLPANDSRRWILLQNCGTSDVYIRIDSGTTAVTTNNGIKVAASGGTFSIADNGQANAAMNGIKAVVASGTSILTVQDGNKQ